MKKTTYVYQQSPMQEKKEFQIELDIPILDAEFEIDNDSKERIFDSIDFAKMSKGVEDCSVKINGEYIGEYTVNWKLIEEQIKLYSTDYVLFDKAANCLFKFANGEIVIYGDKAEAEADLVENDEHDFCVTSCTDLPEDLQVEILNQVSK